MIPQISPSDSRFSGPQDGLARLVPSQRGGMRVVVILLRGEEDTRVLRLHFLVHCAVPSPHPHPSQCRMLRAILCTAG